MRNLLSRNQSTVGSLSLLVLLVVSAFLLVLTTNKAVTTLKAPTERVLSTKEEGEEPDSRVIKALSEVPEFLQYYADWHKQQRKNGLKDVKYLVVACHHDATCGGVSDRLRAIPFLLLLANRTERVLFIKWEKYDLENFLEPPPGGIDWRLPEGIDIGTEPDLIGTIWKPDMKNYFQNPLHSEFTTKQNLIVRTNGDFYGMYRNEFKTKENPRGTFRSVMKIMFKLTKPVMISLLRTMRALDVRPRNYISVHYRATDITYIDHDAKVQATEISDKAKKDIRNAISCAVKGAMTTDLPIYFTSSDSTYVKYAVEEYQNSRLHVVGISDIVRFHSDKPHKNYNYTQGDPRDLYPVFVDLWMMAESKCVSHGKLGFGAFGARLAGEECEILHHTTTCPDVY